FGPWPTTSTRRPLSMSRRIGIHACSRVPYNRRMARRLLGAALLLTAVPLLAMTTSARQTDQYLERAKRLLRDAPVIDGHNDYPWAVREKAGGDIDKLDIRESQPSIMTDIPRLKAGGVGGQFWSVYVPATKPGEDAAVAVSQT